MVFIFLRKPKLKWFHSTCISHIILFAGADNSSIEVNNYPWPKEETGSKKTYNSGAFTSTLLVAMAFCFIPAAFGIDVVKDREVSSLYKLVFGPLKEL